MAIVKPLTPEIAVVWGRMRTSKRRLSPPKLSVFGSALNLRSSTQACPPHEYWALTAVRRSFSACGMSPLLYWKRVSNSGHAWYALPSNGGAKRFVWETLYVVPGCTQVTGVSQWFGCAARPQALLQGGGLVPS